MSASVSKEQVQTLLDRLIKYAPDRPTKRLAQRLRARYRLPIETLVGKLPGDSIIEKAEALGVTRQTIYGWLYGSSRPNLKRAKQIAKLTGFSVEDIRGRADDDSD